MRIVEIRERRVPLSRYADPAIASGDLDTTAVAVITDVRRDGRRVVGCGFASIGRYGQGGLIRERFAPRLVLCKSDLADDRGDLDPRKAWHMMMSREKPGGHGERSIAVGALDMALWDAAAKMAEEPLWHFLARKLDRTVPEAALPVYASGGYYYPENDLSRLKSEVAEFLNDGYTFVKIKIGGTALQEDVRRIEAALGLLSNGRFLAVDAMNRYGAVEGLEAARQLQPYGLRWLEDFCDPLDFEAHRAVAEAYNPPLASGEALFSVADAQNLFRYAALRKERDVLLFDPVHCYGVPEYLRIIELAEAHGWSRHSFQPHGGHLFCLHLAAALGLGGIESNPHSFQPFGGFWDGAVVENGMISLPQAPGIGFEAKTATSHLFRALVES